MRKHTRLLIIDGMLFGCMLILLTTGFVLYFLVPAGNRDIVFLNWNRHDLRTLHFWIALLFTGLLSLHLFMHGSWIRRSLQRNNKEIDQPNYEPLK